jgi:hypothetical protein
MKKRYRGFLFLFFWLFLSYLISSALRPRQVTELSTKEMLWRAVDFFLREGGSGWGGSAAAYDPPGVTGAGQVSYRILLRAYNPRLVNTSAHTANQEISGYHIRFERKQYYYTV